MAYTQEKNGTIIFSGFEKGIADSPYQGIANLRNVNIKYQSGGVYGNYKRLPTTLQYTYTNGTVLAFTGSLSAGATSGTLTANWPYITGSYSIQFSDGETRSVTFTNASTSVTWTGGLSNNVTSAILAVMAAPQDDCTGNTGIIYVIDAAGQIWKQSAVNSSTFNFLGNSPQTGAQGQGINFWENYLVVFRLNFIDFCGDSTGDAGVTSANWNTNSEFSPLGNITNLVLTTGATGNSALISSYTDPAGNNRSDQWYGPTGTYQAILSTGEVIPAVFTFGSQTINFGFAVQISGASADVTAVNILVGTKHASLVSKNDGYLYFCNGSQVGHLATPANAKYLVTNGYSITTQYNALALSPFETTTCLTELISNLIVGGKFAIYPWNRIAQLPNNPIPIPEQLYKMINILNNIYIFAGFKGNIYLSNGFSAYPFKKIPDQLANKNSGSSSGASTVDPQWLWGGVMSHRLRLYFQALAVDPNGAGPIFAGIFSIGLVSGNGITLETPGNLVVENQNSFGLVSSSTAQPGLLIDNNNNGLTYDNYYSAWTNGLGSIGGIDYNNTTLYSNNEIVIETDLVELDSAVIPVTFSNAEFKLNQPMKSGDSITLYARQGLSDTYTEIGSSNSSSVTPSGSTIADFYPNVSFQNWVSIQLMVVMSCNATATSSSYMQLKNFRIKRG